MKVYLVVNDWATEDLSDVSVNIFDSLEKAKKEFQLQRKCEIEEYWNSAFDNGEIRDNYRLNENDFWFEIWEEGYYISSHTRIQILEQEVH